MKKLTALLLVAALLLSAVPAFAASASIRKVEYEGSGKVEVEFKKDVQYKSAKVKVWDEDGKSYTAKIREKDEEDLTFKVSSIAAGKEYKFTISGVRAGRSGSYGSVSGYFETPSAKTVSIRSLDYDREDRELEIEFNCKVQYKSLKVQVKDEDGKSYSVKIREKDNDSVEVRISGLKKGVKYGVKVSGVRSEGADSYGSASKTFRA